MSEASPQMVALRRTFVSARAIMEKPQWPEPQALPISSERMRKIRVHMLAPFRLLAYAVYVLPNLCQGQLL